MPLTTAGQKLVDDAIAAQMINELESLNDPEAAHSNADKLLCELLRNAGFDKTVEAFERLKKY